MNVASAPAISSSVIRCSGSFVISALTTITQIDQFAPPCYRGKGGKTTHRSS